MTFRELVNRFQCVEEAISFLATKGKRVVDAGTISEERAKLDRVGGQIICIFDKEYPDLLKSIPDAPPFLSAIGNVALLKARNVSIVGSRNSSLTGNRITRTIANELCTHGYTIVSGLAIGIDRHAHLGGIDSTIAIIANGLGSIYPPENIDVAQEICAKGLLLTEAPFGVPPSPSLFHGRNRIIAALSRGTLIVEATQNSGSLITANCALDYGRDVFAVPGSPIDSRSYGPNTLIQNGANLVQGSRDIIRYYQNAPQTRPAPVEIPCNEISSDLKARVATLLSNDPVHIDEICFQLQHPAAAIRVILSELELDGIARPCVGGRFALR